MPRDERAARPRVHTASIGLRRVAAGRGVHAVTRPMARAPVMAAADGPLADADIGAPIVATVPVGCRDAGTTGRSVLAMRWRYTPYMRDGRAAPACFVNSFTIR
jgi:hypothetical protein